MIFNGKLSKMVYLINNFNKSVYNFTLFVNNIFIKLILCKISNKNNHKILAPILAPFFLKKKKNLII